MSTGKGETLSVDIEEVERLRLVADRAGALWVALDSRDMVDEEPWSTEAHALWTALAELDSPGITAGIGGIQ